MNVPLLLLEGLPCVSELCIGVKQKHVFLLYVLAM